VSIKLKTNEIGYMTYFGQLGFDVGVLTAAKSKGGDGDFEDAEDASFTYHCATDALLREAEIHLHAEVAAGAEATMQAQLDVARLISGLDLLANGMAMGAQPANVTAMDSLVVSIMEVE
jgi:hypothetical protein